MNLKVGFGLSIAALFGVCGCVHIADKRNWQKEQLSKNAQISKLEHYNRFLIKWANTELNGKTVANKLKQEGIKKVAVYGMEPDGIGWLLCNSLMNSGVEVAYGIDKNAERISCLAFADIPDVRLKLPDEELEEVDLIIVTALLAFDAIKQQLTARYPYKVISLEELVEDL